MAEARIALMSRRKELGESARVALSFAGLRFVAVSDLAALERELSADDPATAVLIDLAGCNEPAAAIARAVRATEAGAAAPLFFLGSGAEPVSSTATAIGAGGDAYFSLPAEAARVLARLATYLKEPLARVPASLLLEARAPASAEAPRESDAPGDLGRADDDDDAPEVTAEIDADTLAQLHRAAQPGAVPDSGERDSDDDDDDITRRVQRLRSRVAEGRRDVDAAEGEAVAREPALSFADEAATEPRPGPGELDAITERITDEDLAFALAKVQERDDSLYPPLEAMPSLADADAVSDEGGPSFEEEADAEKTPAGGWEPPPLDVEEPAGASAFGGFLAPPPTLAEELEERSQAEQAAELEAAAAEAEAAEAAAAQRAFDDVIVEVREIRIDDVGGALDAVRDELDFGGLAEDVEPAALDGDDDGGDDADASSDEIELAFGGLAAAIESAARADDDVEGAAGADVVDAVVAAAPAGAGDEDSDQADSDDEAPAPPPAPELADLLSDAGFELTNPDAAPLLDPSEELVQARLEEARKELEHKLRLEAEARLERELEERVQKAVAEARREASDERAGRERDLAQASERERLEADARARAEAEERLQELEQRLKADEETLRREMRREIEEEARAEADSRVRELENKQRHDGERLREELEERLAEAERSAREQADEEALRIAEELASAQDAARGRAEAEARAEAQAEAEERVAAAERSRSEAEQRARRDLEELQRSAEEARRELEARLRREAEEHISALERRAAEAEERRLEEEKRRGQLEEERRLLAEEDARLRAELEEKLRREVEDRVAAVERHAAEVAEGERRRIELELRAEAEQLAHEAAEEARREAAEAARSEAEEARAAAEERLRAEADEKVRAAEEARAAAEEARAAAEARLRAEADQKVREAEEARSAAEEARALAEESRREAEERLRAEADAKAREADESRRAAEEARTAAEEARAQAEESRRETEERLRAEAEAKAQAAEESRRALEERLRAEAEAKAQAAEESRRDLEERLRAEAEDKARAAEDARREAEERRREAEERLRAEAEAARGEAEAARQAAEESRREAEQRLLAEAEARARAAADAAREEAEQRLSAASEERQRELEARLLAAESAARAAEEAAREAEERTRRVVEEERLAREQAESALKARDDELVRHRKRWGFRSGTLLSAGGDAGEGEPGAAGEHGPNRGSAEGRDSGRDSGESALGVGRISWWAADAPGAPIGAVTFAPGGDVSVEPPPPPERWVPLDPAEGTFADGELPALLWGAHVLGVTGSLLLEDQGGRCRTLHLEHGEPVGFVSDLSRDRPEEALLRAGLITAAKHTLLRAGPLRSARRACSHLVDEGALKPQELFTAIRGVLIEQVLSLLEIGSGRYRFTLEAAHASDRVRLQHRFDAVLAEGVRRKYDLPRLWRVLGGAQTLVGKDDRALRLPPLTSAEHAALTLLDGQRSLEDAVLDSGLSAQDVLRATLIGVSCGAVQVLARGIPGAPEEQTKDSERALAIDKERILDRLHAARHGDYFSFLGIAPESTSFEVQRAAEHVRRQFDPRRYSDPAFRDLAVALEEIRQVADEAETVLHDDALRAGYVRNVIARRSAGPRGQA